jgi:hypothetical protein
MTAHAITIRRAVAADRPVLARLAVLDGARPVPGGTILVAETAGRLHAAWSVEERRAIADPFERTAEEVALLRTRAKQMNGDTRTPWLRRFAPKGFAPAR